MSIIIANHRVKDFQTWKPFYDGDVTRRKAAGLKDLKVGHRSDDPNSVYMIWEAKDPEGVRKMINDPALKELMNRAGVISPPEFMVLNEE